MRVTPAALRQVAPPSHCTQHALSKRLKVACGALVRRRDSPDFAIWSSTLDPNGIAWEYKRVGAELWYYPDGTAPEYKLLPDKGLNQGGLCKRFRIGSSTLARNSKIEKKTRQQYLEERTGWRFDEQTQLYFPPEIPTRNS